MELIAELRRRNVFRVAFAYVVVAWLVLQVGDTLAPALHLGEGVTSVLAFFLILGLPIALFFAWAYELTPDGLRKEEDVDRDTSITEQTGKKFDRMIIGILVVAVAYFAFDKFVLDPSRDAAQVEAAAGQAEIDDDRIERNSIAVLPFADLSPEGDQAYFSDGIAEEILNVLVRVDDLNVASRTSSFGFKGQEALGIPTIAAKLRVRHVLEGSVRKAGDTIRITAQLIDAETDQHLWSDTYDRQLTAESIFSIQDEIAKAIVKELGILIDDRTVAADTTNLDAYELYLKSHQVFLARSDILGAIDLFEQTVAADPGFARAVAGLSAAYAIAPSWGFVDRDYLALAAERAHEAIELDPTIALAWAVLGYVDDENTDYEEALRLYAKALDLNPQDATVWLWRGILYNSLGYFDQAAADIDRCLELDPAYGNCIRHRARSALFSGDEMLAMQLTERAMRIGFPFANPMFMQLYAHHGNSAVVAAMVSGSMRSQSYEPLIDYEYRAIVDPTFDFEAERSEIEAVYRATTGTELDWVHTTLFSPLAFGQFDKARTASGAQFWWQPYPLEWRTSPHRKRLLRELRLPEYWRKHGFPSHCQPVGHDDFECDVLVKKSEKKRRVFAPN